MIHRYLIEATDEVKGFEEAIERLDREWGIEELEPCEDSISRQAVLDIVNNPLNIRLDEIIKKLPPVTPQPKTGHWIRQDNTKEPLYGWYFCSECNSVIGDKPKFCSNCGARMEDKE